jgi:protein-S-isoprenylcysteine O-methyltransferase Ste14
VVAITLGEGFVLGNGNVIWYALIAWLITHVFVVSYEEPTLRKTFGEEYRRYCEHVDRWIPRGGYRG